MNQSAVLQFLFDGTVQLPAVLLGAAASREKLTAESAWASFVGSWVNMEYAGAQLYVQMLVVKPGFTGEDWVHPTDPKPDGTWLVKPKKVWTDREGNTCLQFFNRYSEPLTASGVQTGTARVLVRMDKTGKVLEFTGDFGAEEGAYPDKIDPGAKIELMSIYYLYHRKS